MRQYRRDAGGCLEVPNHDLPGEPLEDQPGGRVRGEAGVTDDVSSNYAVGDVVRDYKVVVGVPVAGGGRRCEDGCPDLFEPSSLTQLIRSAIPVPSQAEGPNQLAEGETHRVKEVKVALRLYAAEALHAEAVHRAEVYATFPGGSDSLELEVPLGVEVLAGSSRFGGGHADVGPRRNSSACRSPSRGGDKARFDGHFPLEIASSLLRRKLGEVIGDLHFLREDDVRSRSGHVIGPCRPGVRVDRVERPEASFPMGGVGEGQRGVVRPVPAVGVREPGGALLVGPTVDFEFASSARGGIRGFVAA